MIERTAFEARTCRRRQRRSVSVTRRNTESKKETKRGLAASIKRAAQHLDSNPTLKPQRSPSTSTLDADALRRRNGGTRPSPDLPIECITKDAERTGRKGKEDDGEEEEGGGRRGRGGGRRGGSEYVGTSVPSSKWGMRYGLTR